MKHFLIALTWLFAVSTSSFGAELKTKNIFLITALTYLLIGPLLGAL